MRRTPSSGCYWGFVLCLRDTLYLFLAIAIIAYALRQIKFTQLLYFLYVSLNNQNINILANFYNTLNASSNFDVLTSFNQAIAVDDFNGDQRFYYNSDEFIDNSQSPTINIKAL